MLKSQRITEYLNKTRPIIFIIYAIFAALATYSSMYAFRKPFAAATFDNIEVWGIDLKILMIIFQSVGYLISKLYGIKIVAELKKERRALAIISTITISWLSLLLFALLPLPFNIIFMFTNGFFLGMIWGFVFSYLEGRKYTEILGAGLSVSFIFSSGMVKSIGAMLIGMGISDMWMPFATGGVFFPIMIISVFLLNQIPEPNPEDEALRTKRKVMNYEERVSLFVKYSGALIFLIIGYLMLTTLRDLRDNFAAEMWVSMGFAGSPSVFTLTEIPVSLVILVVLGLLFIIKSNFKALMVSHFIIILGFMILGVSTYMFSLQIISPMLWVILTGAGLYLGYVPFNSMFFDRMIAAFNIKGNVGFLIYLADSIGYLGSLGVLLYKNFGKGEMSYLNFFISSSYFVSAVGIILVLLSARVFILKSKERELSKIELSSNDV